MSETGDEAPRRERVSARPAVPLGTHVARLSSQGEVLEVDDALLAVFGLPDRQVVGKPIFAWLHAEDRERTRELFSAMVEEGQAAEVVVRPDAAPERWLQLDLLPEAGGRLRVEARDVSDRVAVERELEAQREAERAISELTRTFLGLRNEQVHGALHAALENLGRLADAGRVQLLSLTGGELARYRWHAPGVTPRDWEPGELDFRDYRWATRELLSGRIIHVVRLSDMPPEAALEKAELEAQGVLSYLMIPIYARGRMLGSLDFQRVHEERGWSEAEVGRLELVAELFASVLQRKHAEEALRVSEDRFRTMADNASDVLCETDPAGRLLYVSPSSQALLGYTPEELLRMGSLLELMDPDEVDGVLEKWRNARRVGRHETVAFQVRRADGSWCWIEANGSRYRDREGRVRDVSVLRDVSEREDRRRALDRRLQIEKQIAQLSRHFLDLGSDEVEQGIRDQLRMLGDLAEVDQVWMAWLDADAPDGYWLFEASQGAQVDGIALRALLRGHELAETDSGQMVRIDGQTPAPAGAEAFASDLRQRGVQAFLGMPVRAQGRVSGLLGLAVSREQREWDEETVSLVRLVAEILASALRRRAVERALQESQAQLLQAQKMEAVGTLAGGIAHDFNNHLAVMLGNTRFVRRELPDSDRDIQEALEDLQRSAEHCAQLTGSLLAFSRRGPSQVGAVAVAPIVAEVRELVKPLLPSSIELRTDCAPDLASIEADPVQLQQVLVNLLVNARDAMPEGGTISLHATRRLLTAAEAEELGLVPGAHLALSVSDTGVGMDSATRSRIFEPFFTTKELGKGTGLGLAMVYGIVQDSGGVIEVESELGVGSTFRIILPEIAEMLDGAYHEASERVEGGSETVLLVEDEPAVRRLVSRMLASRGYRVIEASNGREALELQAAHAGAVDLVVTDLMMPELGGIDMARTLVEREPGLGFLFLSGHAQQGVEFAETLTRARLLQKPFDEDALCAEVRALLRDEAWD